MHINLIISILTKLQLGKVKKPAIEIDRIEQLHIEPIQRETVFLEKSNDNLKKTQKIFPIYISDIKKEFSYQIYQKLYQISLKYIENINSNINKQEILKRKNKNYIYFLLIAITSVGLFYLYKYWDVVKSNINILYKNINNFSKNILPFVKWISKKTGIFLLKFFNLLYLKIEDIIKDIRITFNQKYNLILSYFTNFFDFIYNETEKMINKLIDVISNINIIDVLELAFKNIQIVFFTASFKHENQTDKHYKSDNLNNLDDIKTPDYLNNIENKVQLNQFSNINQKNNLDNFNAENIKNLKISQNINQTSDAQDLIYLGTNAKIFTNKYKKFKTAISQLDNSFNIKINEFKLTIDENIQQWDHLFNI